MKPLLWLLSILFLVACGSEGQKSNSDAAEATEAAADQMSEQAAVQDMVVELATRNVICGCALDHVDRCGNYVEIETQYIEIANGKELGLGKMEWCNKEGVQVETAGEVKDGKFVAASLVSK